MLLLQWWWCAACWCGGGAALRLEPKGYRTGGLESKSKQKHSRNTQQRKQNTSKQTQAQTTPHLSLDDDVQSEGCRGARCDWMAHDFLCEGEVASSKAPRRRQNLGIIATSACSGAEMNELCAISRGTEQSRRSAGNVPPQNAYTPYARRPYERGWPPHVDSA